ncbi:leucine-rich repeat extensin-like protein 5 [Triticum aestivum]|uniref:leucine-rich repeat extensin-like protein 5 n=1 Tax=Triticum aestivum TaxID=4565 RepID=UPI001D02A968|nr:leucine-rich repeat extensin-like protein 5 [Triticum aestivum]
MRFPKSVKETKTSHPNSLKKQKRTHPLLSTLPSPLPSCAPAAFLPTAPAASLPTASAASLPTAPVTFLPTAPAAFLPTASAASFPTTPAAFLPSPPASSSSLYQRRRPPSTLAPPLPSPAALPSSTDHWPPEVRILPQPPAPTPRHDPSPLGRWIPSVERRISSALESREHAAPILATAAIPLPPSSTPESRLLPLKIQRRDPTVGCASTTQNPAIVQRKMSTSVSTKKTISSEEEKDHGRVLVHAGHQRNKKCFFIQFRLL